MKSAASIVICLSFCAFAGARAAAQSLDAPSVDRVLAAAHAAAGGAQLDGFAAVAESGTFTQNGGPPSAFDSVTDLHNGYSRSRLQVGPATLLQGYDGNEWSQANGALSIVSLPSFVADAVTEAYLGSSAFFRPELRASVTSGSIASVDDRRAYVLHVEPPGGSPADLYFDGATYHLVKVVAETAEGAESTTNSDFQAVQGVPVAMRSIDVNSTGTTTTTVLTSVHFDTALDPAALARPAYESRGTLVAPASIPFVSDVLGRVAHVVVPVALDGKMASLIFDSGGSNFLVPEAAQRLGIKASGGIATGGVGTSQQMTAFAAVSSVDFGGARLENQDFVVTSLGYSFTHPRRGVAPEGLIGFEYLANFRVIVRYADGRIDVAPFDAPVRPGGVTLPFKSDGRHAYVEATIDGIPGYFLLDTGNAGGLVLNEPFVEANHLFANGGLPYLAPGGVGGGFTELVAAAKSFELAGVTMSGVPVGIPQVKAGFFATRGVAGNLGAGILSRFTVVFDFKAQTATFIPNRNAGKPFLADRCGMSLTQLGSDAIVVRQVIAGAPAAQAGIAAGDRIVAFAGKRVAAGFGTGDLFAYTAGTAPFSLTVVRAGASRTVTIVPRTLLPAPQ